MVQAIDVVFYIFNRFIDFIFNKLVIVDGVSIGWVVVVVLVFGIIFNSLLNIPTGLIFKTLDKRKEG